MCIRPTVALLAVVLTVIGCGGGSGLTSRAPSIRVSRSPETISFGDSVNVSWSSHRITGIRTTTTNFPIPSNLIDGSITDRPSVTTTYTVEGTGDDLRHYSGSTTVTVAPSVKTMLLIGDATDPEVGEVEAYLRTLTTGTINVRASIPNTIAADVLILHPSGSFGSSGDRDVIRGFLQAQGRLLLLSQAPAKLATGNITSNDLSTIGSWFAGATTLTQMVVADVIANSPQVPLSATLRGDRLEGTFEGVRPVSATAIPLTAPASNGAVVAFLYDPSIGGKLGFLGSAGTGSSEGALGFRTLLASLVRWLADSEQ